MFTIAEEEHEKHDDVQKHPAKNTEHSHKNVKSVRQNFGKMPETRPEMFEHPEKSEKHDAKSEIDEKMEEDEEEEQPHWGQIRFKRAISFK